MSEPISDGFLRVILGIMALTAAVALAVSFQGCRRPVIDNRLPQRHGWPPRRTPASTRVEQVDA